MALTNASQQTVNTYAYDPYGRLMAQTETVQQPFQYAGQVGVMAEGQNLYYMRARYYDATVGRFISEDPIGFDGGLNLYAYVGGNPIMAVDPSGLSPTEGARLSQAQIVQFQKDAFDIAIGFAAPISKVGTLVEAVAARATEWTLGAFKSEAKWASQLEKRGWTPDQITEAINKGQSFPAENLVNKGNQATRYVHPQTGQSVVIDNVTKEVIHVGGPGFKY
ncbi:RHS repeat-associated core domain-containing protein [Methylocaldum gracile subsp. desertum]|uniref:RHS repeat-associated core domain-containing protein n=1 Tax=Methylocaldum sp. GT1BW TaxID=3438964 RepID=UPI003D9FF13A